MKDHSLCIQIRTVNTNAYIKGSMLACACDDKQVKIVLVCSNALPCNQVKLAFTEGSRSDSRDERLTNASDG